MKGRQINNSIFMAKEIIKGTMTQENKCCKKGCLEHKYHCGICNYPLTYSPANYCSRPNDIPNACENCHQPKDYLWKPKKKPAK